MGRSPSWSGLGKGDRRDLVQRGRVPPISVGWGTRSGPRDRASGRERLAVLAVEAMPEAVKLAGQLRDSGWAQAGPAGDVGGPLAHHQLLGQLPLAPGQRTEPAGEVDPEGRLLVGRRLRVVVQCFLERVAGLRADLG